jgi:hypothetical protein
VYVRNYVFETELNVPFFEFLVELLFSPLQYNSFLFTDLLKSELRFFEHLDRVFIKDTVTSWDLDPFIMSNLWAFLKVKFENQLRG